MIKRPPIYNYFSKATVKWIDQPSIRPDPEIVTQYADNEGNQKRIKSEIPHNNIIEDKPKKTKKKYLPGERMLMKLTGQKPKSTKMKRIVKNINKEPSINISELFDE